MSKKKVVKRWDFCWCYEDSPPKNGDAHDWRSKIIRAPTFEAAMDKMLAFLNAKPPSCFVDYECAALHVRYSSKKHDAHFHRIDHTEHDLAELCG